MAITAGLDFALPDYARDDLAFQQVETWDITQGLAMQATWTVDGTYIDILVAIQVTVALFAGAGNRQMLFMIQDADKNIIYAIPAVSVQPVGTSYQYTWATNISAAFAAGGIYNVMPLTPFPAFAGYKFTVNNQGVSNPGDTITGAFATMIHVPTGPTISEVVERNVTPVLF